jgi:hypothetical protein
MLDSTSAEAEMWLANRTTMRATHGIPMTSRTPLHDNRWNLVETAGFLATHSICACDHACNDARTQRVFLKFFWRHHVWRSRVDQRIVLGRNHANSIDHSVSCANPFTPMGGSGNHGIKAQRNDSPSTTRRIKGVSVWPRCSSKALCVPLASRLWLITQAKG